MLENCVLFWPPIPSDFKAYTTQQAKEYKRWFIDNIPVRLAELQRIVRLNGGEEIPWDFTVDSLVGLCRWLAPRMTLTPYSLEEQERDRATLPEWLHDKIPTEVMSCVIAANAKSRCLVPRHDDFRQDDVCMTGA